MRFKHAFTIQNVPPYLRPLYWLYAYGLGLVSYVHGSLISLTLRLTVNDRSGRTPETSAIYCFWHEGAWLGFLVPPADYRKVAMITHPFWYMGPVLAHLRFLGVCEFFYGSSGHHGKEAAAALVARLREGGRSTTLSPDGPAGPAGVAKRGFFDLSLGSGLPVIPVRFTVRGALRTRTWDRKIFPLPFARVHIELMPMLRAQDFVATHGEKALSEMKRELESALGPSPTG